MSVHCNNERSIQAYFSWVCRRWISRSSVGSSSASSAMHNDINFDDAFLNFSTSACATTELTLQKSWVTASVGDTATVTVARGGIQIGSLASTANTHTEIDTIGTPIVVYEGEVLEVGETLGAANVSTYGTTFACAGGGSLIGSQLTVGTTPAPIVCTVTNTGPAADLSIAKSVLPGSAPSGQNVEYTLLVTNLGPDPVTGATVTDAPGAGLTCPAAGQPDVSCASTATPSACPGGTQTVSQLQGAGITLGTLQPTDTVTLTYRCTIN